MRHPLLQGEDDRAVVHPTEALSFGCTLDRDSGVDLESFAYRWLTEGLESLFGPALKEIERRPVGPQGEYQEPIGPPNSLLSDILVSIDTGAWNLRHRNRLATKSGLAWMRKQLDSRPFGVSLYVARLDERGCFPMDNVECGGERCL